MASPYINRFLSADTVVANPSDPQGFNRHSYVLGNPLRYVDPSGHASVCGFSYSDPDCPPVAPKSTTVTALNSKGSLGGKTGGGGSGGGSGGSNTDACNAGDIYFNYSLQSGCGSDECQMFATGVGMMGTALDTAALTINSSFATAADIALVVGGPPAYLAAVGLYKLASPIPNIIGTYGGIMWGTQGILLGDTYLDFSGTASSNFWRNEATVSLTISQDTAVSAINDGVGWIIPEPNLAAASSLAGVMYDLGRNPLSPYLSTTPPIIPTFVAPTYSVSYDFSSIIPISSGWSLFPPSP